VRDTAFGALTPNYRVDFSGGGSLLRFYVTGSAGRTLIVLDPSGHYHCMALVPHQTLDINAPADGSYNVWFGAYQSGAGTACTWRSPPTRMIRFRRLAAGQNDLSALKVWIA
jgi:hypothetical protein